MVSATSSQYTKWVQQSLNQVMGLRLGVDGQVGSQTRSAIRSFQGKSGLPADGKVGPRTEAALISAGAPPPPSASNGRPAAPLRGPAAAPAAGAPGVPRIVKRETTPPGLTLYTEIDLGITDEGGRRVAAPMTGIFIPPNYTPGPAVDLILYLHGYKYYNPNGAIDSYWNRASAPFFALREELTAAGKNVILVAPTLGPRSQTGRLVRPGGLDAYLGQVLATLRAAGPHSALAAAPVIGSIILACHSGGGLPMRQLALGNDRAAAAIRECWGFDCTYNGGDDAAWAGWARARPAGRVYIYYLRNTRTAVLSLRLARLGVSNAIVQASGARNHYWVPIAHWAERIRGAASLAPAGQPRQQELPLAAARPLAAVPLNGAAL